MYTFILFLPSLFLSVFCALPIWKNFGAAWGVITFIIAFLLLTGFRILWGRINSYEGRISASNITSVRAQEVVISFAITGVWLLYMYSKFGWPDR
jgi:hypothetical protein